MNLKPILCVAFIMLVACASPTTPTVAPTTPQNTNAPVVSTRAVSPQPSPFHPTTAPSPTAPPSPTTAPSSTAPPSPTAIPTVPPTPIVLQPSNTAPAELAKTITESQDFARVIAATQEALARGGIATEDFERVHVQAIEPAVSITLLPQQTANMASEGQHRETSGTLTIARLGDMLKELGFPFREGATPGEHLIQFLSVWIQGAQLEPNDPHSFTPLFLNEMAKRQTPSINLADGKASAERVYWTMLEIELFTAAFDRVAQKESMLPRTPRAFQVSFVEPVQDSSRPVALLQSDYCAKLKKNLGSFTGQVEGVLIKLSFEETLKKIITDVVGEGPDKNVKDAYDVIKIVNKIANLVTLYNSVNIAVTIAGDDTVHKPAPDEQDQYKQFDALVTVTDTDEDSAVGDCLQLLGLPPPESPKDIAAKLDNWRVEWALVEGSPEHARISAAATGTDTSGQQQLPLKRTGDASGEATMYVQIVEEGVSNHQGEQETADVVAKAELETSEMLKLETLVSAVKVKKNFWLGVAGPIVDVAAGFIQEMAQPKSFATLEVTYHQPLSFLLEGTYSSGHKLSHNGKVVVTNIQRGPFSFVLEPTSTSAKPSNRMRGRGTLEIQQAYNVVDPDTGRSCSESTTRTVEMIAEGVIEGNTLHVTINTPEELSIPEGGCRAVDRLVSILGEKLEFPAVDGEMVYREFEYSGCSGCFTKVSYDFQVKETTVVSPQTR